MDLSIIIVNWNTKDITCDCLRSIYEQTAALEFEVIVVDNASADGSVEQIRNDFPAVQLIANPDNRGFAAANNQGMAAARGRYLLLLNSDTIVLERALEKAVAFADSRPDAGIIGCRVLNPDMSLQRSCFMFPSLLNMTIAAAYLNKFFPGHRFWGRERMTWWQYNEERAVEVVMGAFMLVRRETYEQIGGMDEAFFMYGEETDWCWRSRRAGWQVLFMPEARIIHLGGQSSRQVRRQMILQLRSGILKFIRKNRSYPVYLAACVLTSLWFAVRIVPWLAAALLKPGRWQESLLRASVYGEGAWKSLFGWKALTAKPL